MVGIRRENARSDDSGYGSNPRQHLTIEQWVSQKEKFRVVANGLPMPSLVMRRSCDPKLDEFFQTHVRPFVPDVLRQYNISYTVMHFDYWYNQKNESDGRDTLVIYSRDINTQSWLTAAKAILDLFDTDETETAKNIQVELQNRDEVYNDRSGPLPDDHDLLEELSQLRDKISTIVHTLMRGSWSSIAYHNRVDRRSQSDKVSKPTVIVFCRPESFCDFEAAEDEIMKVLNTATHSIHLEFLPGEVLLLPEENNNAKLLFHLTEKPVNGSSLGIEGDEVRAGTLGGWVFLNLPGRCGQIKCALTCYHVIRSTDQTVAAHTDASGVLPTDPRGKVLATYPASLDSKYMMAKLKDFDKKTPTPSWHGILPSLVSNPAIGSVVLASGHRVTKEKQRLDWALIESPTTFSPNKPPAASSFSATDQFPTKGDYTLNSDCKVRVFGRGKEGDWVTKMGRTTGATGGEINKIPREIEWPEHNKITFEVEIISRSSIMAFAAPGDSGSIVTNITGEMLGLLFAMDSRPGEHDIGFMTPITAIQDDVKQMTGGGVLSLY